MYVGGQKDLQALDQYTMEQLGLPGIVLMENAGFAVVHEIDKDFPDKQTSIVILAGAGNNGGDGFVIARRLHDIGYTPLLCLLVPQEKLKGDALIHFNAYVKRGLPLLEIEKINEIKSQISRADVIIDAILGTGVNGAVKEPFAEIITYVNEVNTYVLAVDIPSGVSADTGKVDGVAIRADKTVTFVLPKKGFFLCDGPRYIGSWKVVDISVSPLIVEKLGLRLPKLITKQDVINAIPKRLRNGHKGTFGHGLIIGGSKPYVGAPGYSARVAVQSGIGLVTMAIPENIYTIAATQLPEALFLPLEQQEGHIAPYAMANIDWTPYKAIAFGPGMSRFTKGETLLKVLLTNANAQPIIVDADGIFYFKQLKDLVQKYKGSILITPHPGEMAILLGKSVQEIEENRIEIAQHVAKEWGVYVLLKGHRSVIATPSGQTWINDLGNDSLSKGGSGDVLTGLVLSFLSQGAEPEQALIAASYLHALSGEQQGKRFSNYGVTPNDVIEGIRLLLNEI